MMNTMSGMGMMHQNGQMQHSQMQQQQQQQSKGLPPHSNIYVRNLPLEFDQTAVECMFRTFGVIVGCKFFRVGPSPYAFVKLSTIEEAHNAITGLNNVDVMGRQIMVKSADTDAVYDTPIDNLYVKNIPSNWTEETIRQYFAKYGNIISVRILPAHPNTTSQGALVRFSSVAEAQAAKDATNAVTPPGTAQALNVKFADTPEEKARKSMKLNARAMGQRYTPYPTGVQGMGGVQGGYQQNQRAGYAGGYDPYGPNSPSGFPANNYGGMQSVSVGGAAAPVTVLYPTSTQGNLSCTVVIRPLPHTADRLALYENFAHFGGVLAVKVPGDGSASIIFVDHASARKAVEVMNNTRLHDCYIGVSLQ